MNSALQALTEERIKVLEEALREVDKDAEAGLCQFTSGGKHCFLKDIRRTVKSTGLQGGLTEFTER